MKPKKLSFFFFTLFWEEYKELWTEHEFMFFKLWKAPNEKINKTNIMLKSPILSHPIQTQTKFKAPLSLSLKSRPMASSKPLSLQIKTQDPWLPQSPSLFKSRPNHHLHGHGFQISSFLISISLLTQTLGSHSLSLFRSI